MKSVSLVRLRRMLSPLSAVCALVALSAPAQAQLKPIEEIEAEIAARRSADEARVRGPVDARYKQITGELEALSERELETSVALPMTGMVAGYAGSALLLAAAVEVSDRRNDGVGLGLALGSVGMLGVGIVSQMWLGSRIRERRELRERREWLRREQGTLSGSTSHRLEARARFERDSATHRELARAREEYGQYGISAPVIMMATGFVLAPPLILLGLLMNAFNNDPTVLITGVASGVVGVSGALWFGHVNRARAPIAARIRKLKGRLAESSPVAVGLQLSPEHASFSLRGRF